jgi:regulatory protein
MDSAVRAEDSSSASANLQVSIQKTEWASAEILKVFLEEGPSLYTRPEYLSPSLADLVVSLTSQDGRNPLSEEDSDRVLFAGRVFVAERKALDYLARAEHSRYLLSMKLRGKGFLEPEIHPALDYLERERAVDDRRFADAWLRNRTIHHCEGRILLLAHLRERGVDARIASEAISAFFSEHDEAAFCEKARVKMAKIGKMPEKIEKALVQKGFSRKIIAQSASEKMSSDFDSE